MPHTDFLFVHETHPVINLLRMNKQLLGMDIDQTQKFDEQWFKLTQALMETSCDTLRSKVLGRIKTEDLHLLQIQLHRLGGVPWDHLSTEDSISSFVTDPSWTREETASRLKMHKKGMVEKPNVFMARILIEYEINN